MRDLSSLALVCRMHRDAAQRELFRNITFDTQNRRSMWRLKTALNDPLGHLRLGRLIKTIHMIRGSMGAKHGITYLMEGVSSIVKNTPALKSITVSTTMWHSELHLQMFADLVVKNLPVGFEAVTFYVRV